MRKNEKLFLRLAVIAGVTLRALRADIVALRVIGIIQLTAGAEIIRGDVQRTGASLTISRGSPCRVTVESNGTSLAFWTSGIVFARLQDKISFRT